MHVGIPAAYSSSASTTSRFDLPEPPFPKMQIVLFAIPIGKLRSFEILSLRVMENTDTESVTANAISRGAYFDGAALAVFAIM